jgi:hypothetical protein
MTERDDVVAGHLQIAEMLAEHVARDLHARRGGSLHDVVAEHRRGGMLVAAFASRRSRGGGDEKEKNRGR